jgi:hypothetical protein
LREGEEEDEEELEEEEEEWWEVGGFEGIGVDCDRLGVRCEVLDAEFDCFEGILAFLGRF